MKKECAEVITSADVTDLMVLYSLSKESENGIKFRSLDGCHVPFKLDLLNKNRCFDFNLKNISIEILEKQ